MVQSAGVDVDATQVLEVDEKELLDIYKRSIPPEFDNELIALIRDTQDELSESMRKLGLRWQFARNYMQGNSSRCVLEDSVVTLAEKHNLKVGIFGSDGGSFHTKVSTKEMVLTFHTLGDQEGSRSRYTEYKRGLSRSNPFVLSRKRKFVQKKQDCIQGVLFKDLDIGSPEPLEENNFTDNRIYYTICVPRFLHKRRDIFLIVPDNMYADTVLEFNYREVRDSSISSTIINIYTPNEIQRKTLRLKSDDVNEIKRKDLGQGKQQRRGEQQ